MKQQMTRVFFVVLFVAALTAGLSSNLFAQVDRYSVSPTPRITQSIDEGNMVKLARNTRPEAKNAANDRGPVPDGTFFDHIFIQLQRSPEQEQLLDKLIDELNDRNSPNFHKWLTPEEFGRFGVAQEDIDKITGWLQYHGLTINQVYPNGVMIDVSGSAGSVREAFHTPLHQIEVNGETHVANLSDPQVPAALAHVVMGPLALNDFKPHPMYRLASDYTFAGCASSTALKTEPGTCYAVTPQDNAVIYNLNPLWTRRIFRSGPDHRRGRGRRLLYSQRQNELCRLDHLPHGFRLDQLRRHASASCIPAAVPTPASTAHRSKPNSTRKWPPASHPAPPSR